MKRYEIHRQARVELSKAIAWYDERQPGLGMDLHAAVGAALAKVEADPGIGARYEDTNFRFYRLHRFPYIIYYQELPSFIWIAAIAHGRRRKNGWQKRKP